MHRLFDLSEDELLDLEGKWWEREDETNLNWILEGEKIYKALSRVNPSEITYRETLGYLLVLQGEDLKLRKHSYEKAIVRFNQVVRIDPQNSRAYYRLGFLYFHQENWAKSVEAFQQSLRCSPNLKSNRLEKEQQVKAHFYILRATQIIAKETMAKVEQIPDEDLSLFGEIHNLLKELKASESQEEKPYQMIINGTEFHELLNVSMRHILIRLNIVTA
ncbi:MAG: tetratricopeptide repeat protein [Bacillaceae bacterium]|nr:tetratricopeptide repeat protein [Bacillaceae bacterium]